MKFGVIARVLDYEGFGVQTLLIGLLEGMLQQPSKHEIVLFIPPGMNPAASARFEGRFRIETVGIRAEGHLSRFIWDHISVPMACSKFGIDALFAPAHVSPLFGKTPAVVCVPDMMYHLFPQWWPFADRMYFALMARLTTARAPRLAAISESTKRDILRILKVPPDRVHVVEPGIPEGFAPTPLASDTEVLEIGRAHV